jgi:hypothetical protein
MVHQLLQFLSHFFPGSLGTILRQLAAAVKSAGL